MFCQILRVFAYLNNPDAQCMVHLPTFTIKIAKCRYIDIPYMEHLGK